jgi:hypothetical protein
MPFFVILQELACAKRLEFFWSVANIHISVQFEFINTMFSSPYGITTELIKIQSCLAAKHGVSTGYGPSSCSAVSSQPPTMLTTTTAAGITGPGVGMSYPPPPNPQAPHV